jgi:hypothetical protein
MQRLEVSGAVRPIYGSLGVKRLISQKYSVVKEYEKDTCRKELILIHPAEAGMYKGESVFGREISSL